MPTDEFKSDETSLDVTKDTPGERSRRPTSEAVAVVRGAQFIALAGAAKGRRFAVRNEAFIGRDANCEVWIPADQVSRRHARLFKEQDRYWLEDLDSRNGTKVNDVGVTRIELVFGDRVTFGSGDILLFTHDDPLEEQLAQAQRLESAGVLAAGIAHEFNNLLAVVIGNLSLIEDNLVTPEETGECIEHALQAATRGAELAQQMLDFSRSSPSESETVNVQQLLAAVERFARQAFGPGIELSTEISQGDSPIEFVGDRMQIYQALINLCLNARDAVGNHGSVHIRASTKNMTESGPATGYIQLEVTDDGRGMSDDVREKAFDPFFTTKGVGEGTGLGLSVVHGIVQAHGGKVSVDSTEGQGTSVRLLLPHVTNEPDEHSAGRPGAGDLRGTVLLVDDNDLLLRATERHLRAVGLDVITASNGYEAVTMVKEHGDVIDVVILDMLMPAMGGTEAFPLIQEVKPGLPVLLVSGHSGKTNAVQDLLTAGAIGFLQKPTPPAELEQVIAPYLSSTEDES